jgi:hypothetical protein
MSNWLTAFQRCLRGDLLKLRRTPALALAVFLPVLPPLISFVFVLQRGSQATAEMGSPVAWAILNMLHLWAMLLVPPFAAVETSLLAGIEHHHGGWRHLLALPVPRSAAYAAKYVAAFALMGIATLSSCGFAMLSLWGLTRLRADAGFAGPLMVRESFSLFALVGVASLFLFAVHAFVAMRWSSFPLNIGLALTGLVSNIALVDTPLRYIVPWSAPAAMENLAAPLVLGLGSRSTPSHVILILTFPLAGAALTSFLGIWGLSRRDVL